MVSNATGAKVETSGYLPYGIERNQTGTRTATYKFTDQELDRATGLYNYDARLYDPLLGLFVTADSVIPDHYDPLSLNRYAYCRNNPLKYTDPDGHVPVETILDIASLIDSVHSMCKDPSWSNAGWLAWDVVGMIPYVPGSWAGKGVKYGAEAVGAVNKGSDIAKTVDKVEDVVGNVSDGVKVAEDVVGASKNIDNLPVKWDGEFAAKQVLGHDPVTPGGKQINFHAADRMVNPPKGRVPMNATQVDDFIDTADSIKKIKITNEGTSVTLLNSKYPKAQIPVDGNRIITVINPKVKK
ncbi:hypothetical protein JCM14469_42580 [Desulfatiferula olefinivorans]